MQLGADKEMRKISSHRSKGAVPQDGHFLKPRNVGRGEASGSSALPQFGQ